MFQGKKITHPNHEIIWLTLEDMQTYTSVKNILNILFKETLDFYLEVKNSLTVQRLMGLDILLSLQNRFRYAMKLFGKALLGGKTEQN